MIYLIINHTNFINFKIVLISLGIFFLKYDNLQPVLLFIDDTTINLMIFYLFFHFTDHFYAIKIDVYYNPRQYEKPKK